MKLKTSLFKKGIIVSDLKRFWWVSVLYTIALFFAVPFYHFMKQFNDDFKSSDKKYIAETIVNELNFHNSASAIFLLVVPIGIGVLVFRYIQRRRSASLYHSLPLTRTELYITSWISSLILFVAPLIFNVIIMFLLNGFSFLSEYYSAALIFEWLGFNLLFGILFLSMSIFVGMFTGSSIAQIIFVYILNFLPYFLVEFTQINLRSLLFGFETYSYPDFYKYMPMSMLDTIRSGKLTAGLVATYIITSIILIIGGWIAFKLRRPETAGDIITFRPVKPIFVFGVTLCATLLGSTYLTSILRIQSFGLTIVGFFISSLLSYIIIQMITNKTFKVLNTYKGYIAFAVVLIVVACAVKLDVFGYVNKIPQAGEVEEVYIGYDINWWQHKDDPDYNTRYHFSQNDDEKSRLFSAPENIENITKLHKAILDKRAKQGQIQYIAYKLKNGEQIIRHYVVDEKFYASEMEPIYLSQEYLGKRFPILHQSVDNIKYMEFTDNRMGKNSAVISDKNKMEQLKKAMMEDINKIDLKNVMYYYDNYLFINITDNTRVNVGYGIRNNFTNTIEWLKAEKLYDKVVLKADQVSYMELVNYQTDNQGKSAPKSVKVEDKTVIQELLNLSLNQSREDKYDYILDTEVYVDNNRQTNFGLFIGNKLKVSPELQKYIDKVK